ncbi:MAG: sulfite exporter TauE/SafE family protein [Halobacteriovoraceae bacterium]|nr:sulfite exporter TauE/SafE family protein [Halobacteriovoraceae bacterium]
MINDLVLLPIAGIFIGLISTIFGVGGGIIAVPTIYELFPALTPASVIGTSLAMIFCNSLLNLSNFARKGQKIQINTLGSIVLPMSAGVLIGIECIDYLSTTQVKLFLVFIVFMTAVRLLWKAYFYHKKKFQSISFSQRPKLLIFIILIGGFVSGLTGLGGGVVIIPLIINFFHTPLKELPVISNFAIASGAFVGLIRFSTSENIELGLTELLNHFQIGKINFLIAFCLFTGSFLTSRLGVKLSGKIHPRLANILFASLLIIMGTRLLIKTI